MTLSSLSASSTFGLLGIPHGALMLSLVLFGTSGACGIDKPKTVGLDGGPQDGGRQDGPAGTGGAGGGAAGTAGTTGSGGRTGTAGAAGTTGSGGRTGTAGAAGTTGSGGRTGTAGAAGTTGAAGAAGMTGVGGTAGARLGPAPVELGSSTDLAAPGSYVILAQTGITNVTGSLITGGNLGLSPAAATYITGFALVADPTTTFATSPSVAPPGKIYASNYTTPTPSNLTTAISAMQAAYSDAAGRMNPNFLNLYDGNLGGKTLIPGLYKWGTGVTIPADVTIAGGSNDVWIFQITNDVDVSSAKQVILSGGARARNIFWQVAGQVTIHATAHFEGIILSQTGITLQTNASMVGRALAQTLVAIDNNAITAP